MAASLIYQLLRYGQTLLVYPSAFLERPRHVYSPRVWGLPYEDLEIQTSDNVTLRCYLLRPQLAPGLVGSADEALEIRAILDAGRLGTVIMFHGNAMNYGDFLHSAEKYYRMNYNVLVVSYRGYGNSEGLPSEKGLRKDAQAALDYLLADPRHSQKPIVLCGLSLGGAVAIDVASRNPSKIAALIVENTFTSLPDVVRGWPIIGPFSFLCNQKWNSASKIPLLPATLPILMMSGERDVVVPQKHMMKLRDIAQKRGWKKVKPCKQSPNDTKDESALANTVFVSLPGGNHGDTFIHRDYWPAVESFLFGIRAPVLRSPLSDS